MALDKSKRESERLEIILSSWQVKKFFSLLKNP